MLHNGHRSLNDLAGTVPDISTFLSMLLLCACSGYFSSLKQAGPTSITGQAEPFGLTSPCGYKSLLHPLSSSMLKSTLVLNFMSVRPFLISSISSNLPAQHSLFPYIIFLPLSLMTVAHYCFSLLLVNKI